MRAYLLTVLFVLGGCYNPTFVSGQVECGPSGACPAGFACRSDNRCWLPGGSEDLSAPPPVDLPPPPPPDLLQRDDMTAPPSPFLRVRGGRIVDGAGREARLTGVNWFGLETASFAPHGLWARPLGAILDDIKRLGYNMIRLPFSNLLLDPASKAGDVNATQNPDLVGLTGLQILDRVIAEAGKRGLRVVLARHQVNPTGGQTGLWYTPGFPEARFVSDWTALATRYRNTPTVVAFDLHHEPHGPATWGDSDMKNDWRLAAERTGKAVLAAHPGILVVVQGIDSALDVGYWWGGNHRLTRTLPVRLPAESLVYGANDYPRSVSDLPWFRDAMYPNNLPALWDSVWGFFVKDPDASKNTPVLISGFGGKMETMSDRQWIGKLGEYIQQNRLSFAYWCLNPDAFYGGILKADWAQVEDARHNLLKPLLAPLIP